jgi:hypothetical protein
MESAESQQLLLRIVRAFPSFQAEWLADNEGRATGTFSQHSVWMSFLPYVARFELDPRQLKHLALLVNDSVAAGEESENAVSTCFLEGISRSSELGKSLWPALSPASRISWRG